MQYIENGLFLQTAHVHAQINTTLEQALLLCVRLEQLRTDYCRGTIRRYWTIIRGKEKEILAKFSKEKRLTFLVCFCRSYGPFGENARDPPEKRPDNQRGWHLDGAGTEENVTQPATLNIPRYASNVGGFYIREQLFLHLMAQSAFTVHFE